MCGSNRSGRIIGGLLLIAAGFLFLLNNLEILTFGLPDFLLTWQFFFIAFGVLLILAAHNKIAGLIFISIGLFNLYPELWPLIFVFIGTYIILRRKKYNYYYRKAGINFTDRGDPANYIDDVAIFGGSNKVHNIDNFRGGAVTSIFGGSEINMLNCTLADGDNFLEVTSIFGGSTIIVPKNWNVVLDITPIFGGWGDKRIKEPNIEYLPNRKLIIKGISIFGGGEIKNYK